MLFFFGTHKKILYNLMQCNRMLKIENDNKKLFLVVYIFYLYIFSVNLKKSVAYHISINSILV